MKVLEFPRQPLTDIPAQLRQMADAIEAGEHGDVPRAVFVLDPEDETECLIFGWGALNAYETITVLELAKARMLDLIRDAE